VLQVLVILGGDSLSWQQQQVQSFAVCTANVLGLHILSPLLIHALRPRELSACCPALLCCLTAALIFCSPCSGLLCTDAILSSISEEKAVVQLAQELVKHEAVVAEASRAQQKAKEAAAAVDAVSTAAQQLSNVTSNTNNTLGALTAAAEALSTIAAKNGSSSGAGDSHSMWDLKGR
jgi:hypothetical protein